MLNLTLMSKSEAPKTINEAGTRANNSVLGMLGTEIRQTLKHLNVKSQYIPAEVICEALDIKSIKEFDITGKTVVENLKRKINCKQLLFYVNDGKSTFKVKDIAGNKATTVDASKFFNGFASGNIPKENVKLVGIEVKELVTVTVGN